ncbi:MAG: urocanate hydratase, partial [Bdellovibrionota bacterium]
MGQNLKHQNDPFIIPLPPTGPTLTCKGWHQEAALRCLLNNLHPDVAEDRDRLIVYGGNGQAARNINCLKSIIRALKTLENDETLLIQSGKPVGILKSHAASPRVLIANSNLVPHWATWDHFNQLKNEGKMMYGQMTAGSWIYIGSQGILQGTYETFMAAAIKHYGIGRNLARKIILSAGMGGMGGAQPLAVKMAGGIFIGCDVDANRIKKRLQTSYLDYFAKSYDEAIAIAQEKAAKDIPFSVAVTGNAADFFEYFLKKNIVPSLVTDQTSAHDPLYGYVPRDMDLNAAQLLRSQDPKKYTSL